jgi:hypothetical protein
MKRYLLLVFVVFVFPLTSEITDAIEIQGGKIEDVVVANSGSSDTTFVTELKNGWLPKGPNSFDMDKDGNIYILDWLGGRVQKFDNKGKWILNTPLVDRREEDKEPIEIDDIAVDKWGNIYVVGGRIVKFSPQGKRLLQIPSQEAMSKGILDHTVYSFIQTDKDGRLYNFGDKYWGGVVVYDSQGKDGVIVRPVQDYKDIGIVQKELGNDVYFRDNKYLVKTRLEEFAKTGKPEIVAIMPNRLRLEELRENEEKEEGWTPPPLTFLGFDRANCFYFDQEEHWYNQRDIGICLTHIIYKYHLEDGKLEYVSEATMDYERGKPECSDKELFKFHKQFIVTSDGTIYFLHGTVDKIKVSKITMN